MANGDPPTPKPRASTQPSEALRRLLGEEALPTFAKALRREIGGAAGDTPISTAISTAIAKPASKADAKGGIAGSGDDEKKPVRQRRGKVTTRGRHRVMNHWEIFDSELNELGGLQQDAIRSFSLAGFFIALALDVLRDIFTSHMSAVQTAIWATASVFCAVLAGWNYLNGRYAKKRGATRLQEIKDEHDEQ